MAKRTVSDVWLRKAFSKVGTVAGVARRCSISYVWAARRLQRLGLISTKTGRSK
ncbi:MAG: hypothetical protein WA639_23225 [Candidatus Acidiferrum sp.]